MSDGAHKGWAGPESKQRRGEAISKAKRNSKLRTHCRKGHEFTPENTVTDIHGERRCRTCRNAGRSTNAANKRASDPAWREKERESHRAWAAKKYHADPAAARKKQRNWLDKDPKNRESAHQSAKNWRERNHQKLTDAARIHATELRALAKIGRSRPADWMGKPTDWRIIGGELLSKEHMSNKELAARLDASRIAKCPYGDTWEASVKERGFEKFINQIRGWVRRPGKAGESKIAVNSPITT